MKKQAIVCHSGGMDSSLCLALARQEHGNDNVLSMSFSYGQRHSIELQQALKICKDWQVDHITLQIDCLQAITSNALMDEKQNITHLPNQARNTLVIGRNGLMARLAAIHADNLGADYVYMGVLELEQANSGYRDCSRYYMDLEQQVLRIDLDNPLFEIKTPLVYLSKFETMELGLQLGVLDYLLQETVSCYQGIQKAGCKTCPACKLRNQGIREFSQAYPEFVLPYQVD